MRSFRWRISALLSALVMATGMLAVSAPAAVAAGAGQMEWTGSRWEDAVCDTAGEQFDLRLYRDASYGGTQWRMCASHPNLCWNPYGADSPSAALCLNAGYDGDTANDYPSCFKLVSIAGGSMCRVLMMRHANYGGGGLVEWDPVNRTSMFPYNDAVSSVKRDCS